MKGEPDANMAAVWDRLLHHFRELGIADRYRQIHIGMLCQRSRPNSKFPKLRGKAVELKNLGAPLLCVWVEYMNHDSVVHRQIRLVLQSSVRMEEIVAENRHLYCFGPALHADLMRQCENFQLLSSALAYHFNTAGTKVFNIVPKHHLLWHCCHQAGRLNPRLTWCFSGEDYMQHMRRLAQSVLRGTPAWMVSVKLSYKFVRGYTWRLRNR